VSRDDAYQRAAGVCSAFGYHIEADEIRDAGERHGDLLAALAALEAEMRAPVDASAFGTAVANTVYEEACAFWADRIVVILNEHAESTAEAGRDTRT
jgi:hypothetical protein